MQIKPGVRLLAGHLDPAAQAVLLAEVLEAARSAPFRRHKTPGGKAMSVAMTALGPLGWVSDRAGYRYQPSHPDTGEAWPPMPQALLDLWRQATGLAVAPDSCLVNRYEAGARMGLHQDRDEADLSFPVVSVSLGDTAVFRLGGLSRRDPTASLRLASGDVLVLEGEGRLVHHGVDRILAGSSRLVPGGGRINLTLRRAGPVALDSPLPPPQDQRKA
ncbi:alpha-ketoglutarate-dependent dioxygenase AlkB [Phenylobacterium sp.]|uniref:alpha-ketoglutarate-dependent dioxygenase AlkB n=1 Tax=Phenylobacterium sp. TaxID=1871053 RepID=UPI002FD8D171